MIGATRHTSLIISQISVTFAQNTTQLSGIADLVAFIALCTVSVLMVRQPEQTLHQNIIKFLSALLCLCAVLHLVSFWNNRQSGADSIVASGITTALLLLFASALLPAILRRRSATADLKKTRESLEQAREQLSREQFMFAALVDNMPDSIYFKDRESRFVRCNQTVADTFQLDTPTDVIGKCDHDFLPRVKQMNTGRTSFISSTRANRSLTRKNTKCGPMVSLTGSYPRSCHYGTKTVRSSGRSVCHVTYPL
ncbi:MAG: PAS domain-containing protein [Fuerstiella sp.]|jgi:PAS domain-containing protein|nr:PAS domain-containing protein [Fuerstiella sp.]